MCLKAMSSPLTQIRTGEADADTEPRVLALDGANVDEVFEALASRTRRQILESLYEEPSTPSELATATDTSLQNVHYHIEKLSDVDLVESVGTRYSEKGAEMAVFAPTSDPLVIVEGEEDRAEMESRMHRLIGGVGTIVAGSFLAQFVLGGQAPSGGSGGDVSIMTAETATESAAQSAPTGPGLLQPAFDVLAEPGAMVLVGGLTAVLVLETLYRRG